MKARNPRTKNMKSVVSDAVTQALALIAEVGAEVVFLPACSSDLNPI